MMKEEKICNFVKKDEGRGENVCRILNGITPSEGHKRCDGHDTSCKFFKTKEKFWQDWDKAIDRCREKGLCDGCRYFKKPCVKSNEATA